MTATKKSIRFLTILTLVFAMVLSIASVPASAASSETWNKGFGTYDKIPPFCGMSISPAITMGSSGKLTFYVTFSLPGNPINLDPARCTVEIRDKNGAVLSRGSASNAITLNVTVPSINVSAGQNIFIYTSAYDTATGNPRNASVKYHYTLT